MENIEYTTMIYLKKDDCYLLLLRNKEKNDINEGKWIGVGGHLEKGETKEHALLRETKEETGLEVKHFEYRGKLLFVNDDFEEVMYLYLVDSVSGNLIECDEGELKWIKEEELMSLDMWEGDKVFLPILLDKKDFIYLKLIYKNDTFVKSEKWDGK